MIGEKVAFLKSKLFAKDGSFLRWQLTVLGSMYVGYAAFMVCRNTLIASSAQMVEDPSLGMDTESFGRLMSWHSAGAIAGKLVTGPLADRLGGRRTFLLALSLTAIANVGFAFGSSFVIFALFNFFGQFAKAGGWPAMTKMVAHWYPESRYGLVWSVISTSSRVGTILAGVVLGWMLSLTGWRNVFLFSAVITGVVVMVLYWFMKDTPEDAGLPSLSEALSGDATEDKDDSSTGSSEVMSPNESSEGAHPFNKLTIWQALGEFFLSGRFWSICFSIFFLTIVMDFLNFIPIYLNQSLGISAARASMAGSAFPTGMLVALVLTSVTYDRLSKRRLVFVLGGLLIAAIGCVFTLRNLDVFPSEYHSMIAIAVIFVLGLTISPAYYVPMSVFSVSFGGKHSGFLVSLIDVCGYCGAMLFNFFGGSIAQDYGWPVFLYGLMGITTLSCVCMVTFLVLDSIAASRESSEQAEPMTA